MPFFSVVIPTYERPDDLRRCLDSIKKSNQDPCPNYEIIITDDSKSDLCKRVVEDEFPMAIWCKGKQIGPAGNRNAGTNRATGQWIVFMDDDCIAEPGFLRAYAKAIQENPTVEIFEGRIFPDRRRRTWAESCPCNENGGLYWTSNLCVSKSLFQRMKGFDENFEVAYEDVDFAYRAKIKGVQFLFVREAQACHPWRSVRQGGKNWKVKNYESADFLRFLKKHNPKEPEFSLKRYFRNICRMITTDFICCIWEYRMKGLDILFFQVFVSIKSMIDILIHKRK